jgi:hypothetical protein
MKIEVSVGDVVDKYSILELKNKYITDENKKIEIQKETNELKECKVYIDNNLFYYNLLLYINNKIWDLTDIIKKTVLDDNVNFSNISKQIFDYNQKRFRIKNLFNILTDSSVKEQKSYDSTFCEIIIHDDEDIYNKIAEINYLLIDFDFVIFDVKYANIIQRIFKSPNCVFTDSTNSLHNDIEKSEGVTEKHEVGFLSYSEQRLDGGASKNILLKDFLIPENENKNMYEFIPIKYISGGKLGDFIHQLSVVNEYFYETGRKGILYISESNGDLVNFGDTFTYGIQNTYSDTYPLLIKQRYIYDYKIYNHEKYDINLNHWRGIFSTNKGWDTIFKDIYDVSWGKHKWIHTNIDASFKDKIVVNTVHYRFCENINFNKLYEEFKDKMVFLSTSEEEYNYFVHKTGLTIPFHIVKDFETLCTIINSCKLFVGSTSAPLTIAHALFVEQIAGSGVNDTCLFCVWSLKKIWDHIQVGYN